MWIQFVEVHIVHVIPSRRFFGDHLTEHQLRYLYERFDASPKDLILHARDPAKYEDYLCKEIDKLDTDRLERVVRDPRTSDSSHLIITTAPSSRGRFDYDGRITSRYVFDLLWKKHICHRVDLMGFFYNQFQADTTSAPAAGWIFKLRMHRLLMQEQTTQLFPIGGRQVKANFLYDDYTASEDRQNPMNLQLAKSNGRRLVERYRLQKNRYYRPKSKDFPAIDSLLLIHPPNEPSPILLIFQITWGGREHDVNEKGLRNINDLKLPRNTRRYYVVVTPERTHPTMTVPMKHFRNEGQQEILDDEDGNEEQQEMLGDEDGDEMSTDEGEEVPAGRDEEMLVDEGEEMPADKLFPAFHCPVPVEKLFVD